MAKEISDNLEKEKTIKFSRRINAGETRELMKYLVNESLLEIMSNLDEGSLLKIKEGKIEEYSGLVNNFSGYAYKSTFNVFAYFDGEIETGHLKSLKLSNEDIFNFENEETKKLWGDLRYHIGNYFLEHPQN